VLFAVMTDAALERPVLVRRGLAEAYCDDCASPDR
jgi:hypothetical protein